MGISTHILDTSLGKPVAGIAVTLSVQDPEGWRELTRVATNADGRCPDMLGAPPIPGLYRLHFHTEPYFATAGSPTLYPFVEITFHLRHPAQHHHIPLLLAANGFTTYRGS